MDTAQTAYVIGNISIRDAEQWADYRRRVPGTLQPWGGELMLRGEQGVALSGAHRHADVVVIRFPDRAAAQSWFDSDAYQALIPLRTLAADVDLVIYSAS
ncbi:MAG: DUF1330 domain-containing protein [Zoogloeaceae bacterium]|nr:DUF1330 domain-containing protein [Zoogloeaceae bacterium]